MDRKIFNIGLRRKAKKDYPIDNDSLHNPKKGLGKTELIHEEFKGCWSRRIAKEHRIIYQIFEDRIHILQCRFHYSK